MKHWNPVRRALAALSIMGILSHVPGPVQANVEPGPIPPLALHPNHIDLGMILDAVETTIPIVVENRSNLPIDIADVVANCAGCISYELDRSHLAPEESTLLRLVFSPTMMRGDVQLFVAVVTGDPNDPQRTLEINASVAPCYVVDGGPVAFSKIIQGYPQKWRVAVEPLIELDQPLDKVVSESPGFSGSVHYDEQNKQYIVDISAGEGLAPGLHKVFLSLQSSAGEAPPCVIPVGATVQEPFLVFPDRLMVAPTSQEQLRIVVLEHYFDPPLQVTGIELPGSNCRYQLYEEAGLSKTWLNVYFYDVNALGAEGDIIIYTSHPAYPKIVVPVTTQDMASLPIQSGCSSCPKAKAKTRGQTRIK